jgi:hypothetical protein
LAERSSTYRRFTFVEVGSDRFGKLVECGLVVLLDVGEGENGGGLLVDDGTESRFALDDAVWHVHLSAKGWEPDDNLQKRGKKKRTRMCKEAGGWSRGFWLSSGEYNDLLRETMYRIALTQTAHRSCRKGNNRDRERTKDHGNCNAKPNKTKASSPPPSR